MCTAISYPGQAHYFGRNLDLERSFGEQVVICPRRFPLADCPEHPALIGMAATRDGYPLFYDATNEYGLSAAALNFPGNAVYHRPGEDKTAIPAYDLIGYLLTRCKNVTEAAALLEKAVITDTAFSTDLPPTPLHWLLADRETALVIESMADGLHLYENPVGVLTNNPSFDRMRDLLSFYMGLSRDEPENRFAPSLPLIPFTRGLGSAGLPGDFSSPSRFVRAAFVLHNSPPAGPEQLFHILDAVAQPDGCVAANGSFQKTIYSSCCDTVRGIYYYCTWGNRQLTAVDMRKEDLNSTHLLCFPQVTQQQIRWEN